MNTASAPATAAARSVVKSSRPAAILAATSAASPGSKIGISPRRSRAIFAASWSTQVTDSPNSEKHAPDTRPTYPVPIIAIRIRSILLGKAANRTYRAFQASALGSCITAYGIVTQAAHWLDGAPGRGYTLAFLSFALGLHGQGAIGPFVSLYEAHRGVALDARRANDHPGARPVAPWARRRGNRSFPVLRRIRRRGAEHDNRPFRLC